MTWCYRFVFFILQACFHPTCHFHLRPLRVQWATGSLVHHWWAMAVSVSVDSVKVQFVLSLFDCLWTGGPPYPPNQYGGGGRGNYDNFRGQGGYMGKPHNMRWVHYSCDYWDYHELSLSVRYWPSLSFFNGFLAPCFMFAPKTTSECHEVTHATSLNIVTWTPQTTWISSRMLTWSFQSFVQTCIVFCLPPTVN